MFNMQETKWRPHKYDKCVTSSSCRETDVKRNKMHLIKVHILYVWSLLGVDAK